MALLFPDLYTSAIGKAAKISPTISGVTLGPNSVQYPSEITVDAVEVPVTSTPRRPMAQLSKYTLRRPHKAAKADCRTEKMQLQKTLLFEVARKSQFEITTANSEIEERARQREEAILTRLAHVNAADRAQRKVELWNIENGILNRAPLSVPDTISGTETEEDKSAARRAEQRCEKLRQNVEASKKKVVRLKELLDTLFQYQAAYLTEYKKIVEIIDNCREQKSLGNILDSLRQDSSIFENIIKNPDAISQDDLKTVELILKNIRSVHNIVKKEAEKINDAVAEREKKFEREKKQEEEQAKAKLEEKVEKKVAEETALLDFFDSKSLTTYTSLKAHHEEVKKTLAPLLQDDGMKKFRFDLQKAATTPVNAISPVSGEHMRDKYKKLHNLLSGQRVDAGGVIIQANQHPLGISLCKEILAKIMVRQGDLTVSSKPDAAFSLASVLVNLWTEFPDFGVLVLAHFQDKCPYLAPVFLPQLEGQSNLDYYIALGYQCYNGEIEKQDKFLKRMKGIMRLYAAVLITKPRNGKPNPLGISEAWRWLAAVLNLEPRPDICAVLILELLEVAGHELLQTYGCQFKKMLAYICQEYFPRLEQVTTAGIGGPLTRLEIFLQEVVSKNTIRPPKEVLSPNFW